MADVKLHALHRPPPSITREERLLIQRRAIHCWVYGRVLQCTRHAPHDYGQLRMFGRHHEQGHVAVTPADKAGRQHKPLLRKIAPERTAVLPGIKGDHAKAAWGEIQVQALDGTQGLTQRLRCRELGQTP